VATLKRPCRRPGRSGSRERVREIEVRAFEKLQKAMIAAAANGHGAVARRAA
jgi:hypothetical protein